MYTDLVNQHKTLSKKHKANNLSKLAAIAKMAKASADSCVKLGNLQHTRDYYNNQPVGQNLYVST